MTTALSLTVTDPVPIDSAPVIGTLLPSCGAVTVAELLTMTVSLPPGNGQVVALTALVFGLLPLYEATHS